MVNVHILILHLLHIGQKVRASLLRLETFLVAE